MNTPTPEAIAADSFTIIREHLATHGYSFAPAHAAIIERIIHSQGDFDFATITHISPGAVDAGVAALQAGCAIVTDVHMVRVGISARRVAALGSGVHCFVADAEVQEQAPRAGTTRSAMGMRTAAARGLLHGGIVAIGNAPTALTEVLRLEREEGIAPALIIGVPVGFVGTIESKTALMHHSACPWIVTEGYKGGSSVAVAAVNALLRLAMGEMATDI